MTEPRYRPLERLAAGGMAEVFIAEATSVQGFKKKVAIKRVLPHLAQNKNFIGMFLDEARLGARMSHANCVTVFDIGAADNTYFIVMEFVDGCDLKSIVEHFRRREQPVPLKEAIFIAMEACRGLCYAHELQDDDGHELGIVHRDISPPNVLISKRGEVKVTDFGLAKASTQLEKTDPGVVKGKFAYLAPEAVSGQDVDRRADVFAMGIVLWEMISGQRLFLGDNDYQTIKLVEAADVPPLANAVEGADSAIDAILAKALAREVADRYQSAREFGDALAGYLFGHGLKVTNYDIATLVKVSVAEAEAKKPKQSVAASILDKLINEELVRFTSIDSHTEALFEGPAEPSVVKALDTGSFVDTGSWFGDDDLAGEDLGGSGSSPPVKEPPRGSSPSITYEEPAPSAFASTSAPSAFAVGPGSNRPPAPVAEPIAPVVVPAPAPIPVVASTPAPVAASVPAAPAPARSVPPPPPPASLRPPAPAAPAPQISPKMLIVGAIVLVVLILIALAIN